MNLQYVVPNQIGIGVSSDSRGNTVKELRCGVKLSQQHGLHLFDQ